MEAPYTSHGNKVHVAVQCTWQVKNLHCNLEFRGEGPRSHVYSFFINLETKGTLVLHIIHYSLIRGGIVMLLIYLAYSLSALRGWSSGINWYMVV
jgi:hypothetical protein